MYNYCKYRQFKLSRQGKRRWILYCLICVVPFSFVSSMENNGRGTKAIGMANAFVAVSDNSWAIDYNPAGIAQLKNMECSVFISPNQFGLSELKTVACAIGMPLSFGAIALKGERFGFDLYNETEIGTAISLDLNQCISLGIAGSLNCLTIARYGSTQYLTIDVGMLSRIHRRVQLGFCMSNITKASIGRMKDRTPQQCNFGVSWRCTESLFLSMELEKDIRYPASIKWGLEQTIFDVLKIHGGIANNPNKYSTGVAVQYASIEFGYAGYSHVDLGWTHQIDVTVGLFK